MRINYFCILGSIYVLFYFGFSIPLSYANNSPSTDFFANEISSVGVVNMSTVTLPNGNMLISTPSRAIVITPDGKKNYINLSPSINGSPIKYTIISSDSSIPQIVTQNPDGTFVGSPTAVSFISPIATAMTNGPITVITSESIPGANCTCVTGADCTKVETRKYSCIVQPGLAGFQTILAQVIRYIINIVLLLGVLAVVGLGITWSFAGGDDVKMKSTLKTWAINIIVGLIILFLFKYILMFIAPWIYQ